MKNIVACSRIAQRAGERQRARATMFFLDPSGNALEIGIRRPHATVREMKNVIA
jgi:extradiol dioxygenase family protein